MKTVIATLAAAGVLAAAAVPAAAQPYGHDHGRYDRGWDNRGDRYDLHGRSLGRLALNRVSQAIDDHRLSPREGRRLHAEALDLYQTEARFGGNGMDPRERQIIRERFDRLMARLDREVRDRDYGYGYYR
jgi:hypothetical protein